MSRYQGMEKQDYDDHHSETLSSDGDNGKGSDAKSLKLQQPQRRQGDDNVTTKSQQSLSSTTSSPPSTPRRRGGTSKRRQRQSLKRPHRLSWPTGLSSQEETNGTLNETKQSSSDSQKPKVSSRSNNNNKRARFSPISKGQSHSTKKNSLVDNIMWVEKYTPTSSQELCVAPKKIKEIQAWMEESLNCDNNRTNGPKRKLLVLVGSPGIGKSTCVRVLANEKSWKVQSWNESFQPRTQGSHPNDIMALEQSSALDSFEEFLQSSGAGFSSLDLGSGDTSHNNETNKTLILLEDFPNLHGREAEMKFRGILSRHLQRSMVPTILIYSDVSEGKHRPEDLERIVDPNDLYDNEKSSITQIHAVTKPKMKKILATIGKKEHFPLDTDFVEEIHSQSHGDLRHAIMTLQLHDASCSRSKPSIAGLRHGKGKRDTKLSTFHSLGKLLYAKRTIDDNGDSRLAFDPDTILERSDLGLQASLRFLEFHSLDFFSDISDISQAYQCFSDAVEILDTAARNDIRGQRQHDVSQAYPNGCAGAIAGRAVANTNHHPAPNKFRQFSRPKVFDVLQNRKQNQILVEQLSQRLSNYRLSPASGLQDTGIFVTEMLPFVRCIVPHEVDPVVNNLYSVAAARNKYRQDVASSFDQQKEELELKQQAEILGMDDIVSDFDDNDAG